MEEQGIPNLKAKLQQQKEDLENAVQEIKDLDLQMKAIKSMKSKEEFKKACDSHVDVKLEMTLKKARCRKEVQKSQRALNTMN